MNEQVKGRLSRSTVRAMLLGCLIAIFNTGQLLYKEFHDESVKQAALAEQRPLPAKPPLSQRMPDVILRSLLVVAAAWVVAELVVPRRKAAEPPAS